MSLPAGLKQDPPHRRAAMPAPDCLGSDPNAPTAADEDARRTAGSRGTLGLIGRHCTVWREMMAIALQVQGIGLLAAENARLAGQVADLIARGGALGRLASRNCGNSSMHRRLMTCQAASRYSASLQSARNADRLPA